MERSDSVEDFDCPLIYFVLLEIFTNTPTLLKIP